MSKAEYFHYFQLAFGVLSFSPSMSDLKYTFEDRIGSMCFDAVHLRAGDIIYGIYNDFPGFPTSV